MRLKTSLTWLNWRECTGYVSRTYVFDMSQPPRHNCKPVTIVYANMHVKNKIKQRCYLLKGNIIYTTVTIHGINIWPNETVILTSNGNICNCDIHDINILRHRDASWRRPACQPEILPCKNDLAALCRRLQFLCRHKQQCQHSLVGFSGQAPNNRIKPAKSRTVSAGG